MVGASQDADVVGQDVTHEVLFAYILSAGETRKRVGIARVNDTRVAVGMASFGDCGR